MDYLIIKCNFSIFADIYYTNQKGKTMEGNNTNNSHLNNSRESVNKNIGRYSNLGKSLKIALEKKRSFRSF